MNTDQSLTAAGIAGGFLDSVGNWISQRENRNVQIDLMRQQNAFQEKMYERQLRDNSPVAQVSRLVSAGLNPALTFGDAANVSTPSVGSAPAVQAPESHFSDVSLNAASIINQMAAAGKESEEAKGLNVDNQFKAAEWISRLDKMSADIEEIKSRKGLNESERNKFDAEAVAIDWQRRLLVDSFGAQKQGFALNNALTFAKTEMAKSQARDYDASAALKECEAKLKSIGAKYEPARLSAVIQSMLADAGANNALAEKYKSDKAVADELKRKTGLEADQVEAIKDYIVPRIRSEIYRNSLGNSSVKLGPVSYGGTRSAYDHMFEDIGSGNKYEREFRHKYGSDTEMWNDKYGNGD